jgi:SAM-dependent methyltransferase
MNVSNITMRLRVKLQGRVKSFSMYLPYVRGKSGLEIGGPSGIFGRGKLLPIYEEIGTLDNCNYSASTVWGNHSKTFLFNPKKAPGRMILCEGSVLDHIASSSYDVVLSSHSLEHLANPVKALKEWQRVLHKKGALVLVLPYYRATFDHKREPTSVEHMKDDYKRNVGEDDLTHLPEILEKHDLSRDLAAGSKEQFHKRSLDNLSNRCLHHHVFDEHNSRALLTGLGFHVLAVDLQLPFHICILATC